MLTGSHRNRILVVFVSGVILFVLVLGRLYSIQLGGAFRRQGRKLHHQTVEIPRRRGSIMDRNGNLLALSIPTLSLYVDPRKVENPIEFIRVLTEVLPLNTDELARKLDSSKSFEWVARQLDPPVVEKVRALKLKGLGWRREHKRYYPNGTMAANVIGFVGIDGKGLEGVEYQLDETLRAEAGEKSVLVGLNGMPLPHGERIVHAPTGGLSIHLTIDEVIQHVCEKELDAIVDEYHPRACFALVMDPATAEVLAWAVRPTFDPNHFARYPEWSYRNRIISHQFEPGSVFKVVPASAALEDKRATPDMQFYCPGYVKFYGHVIGCTSIHGSLSFRQVIEKSCNAGIAQIARVVGPENFYVYMRKFGFGEKTGVSLPGEIDGKLRPPEKWSGLSLGSMSIGQEIGVTGLQMGTAICAIANGGRLLRPQVVKRIVDTHERRLVKQFSTEYRRRVISPETARVVTDMMTLVVASGTGKGADVQLYQAAGKTGTAQILGGPPTPDGHKRRVASFAGFIPASNPVAAIYVVIIEPRAERISGGALAAPAFKEIARKIMRYRDVTPDKLFDRSPFAPVRESEEPAPAPLPVRVHLPERPVPVPEQSYSAEQAPLPGMAGIGPAPGRPPAVDPSLEALADRPAVQSLAPGATPLRPGERLPDEKEDPIGNVIDSEMGGPGSGPAAP